MPKTSGYPRAKDQILAYVAEKQPKELDRATVASMLQVSISTAGNYLMLLAQEFPENLTYVRGILSVKSVFPESRLPPEVRLKTKEQKIASVKDLAEKIEKNHLAHKDSEQIRKGLKQLRQELEHL